MPVGGPGPGRAPGLGWSPGAGCAVCGATADCNPSHQRFPFTYPAKEEPMPHPAGHPIHADRRIFEHDRLIYAPGDVVPYDHAVRLGLIPPADQPDPEPEPSSTAEPADPTETAASRADARARRQSANRQTVAPEDRSA